ncbi:hypothetical protein C8R43DRAFT_1086853 [Mycena crocata]|nr:hypothetical protein C8R43DRAFT_1086853 [Mycena crocata]
METEHGVERGSYISGRSVNDTDIERLWYNVSHPWLGFGHKWKLFFVELKVNHGLEWAAAWNSHNLQIHGEHTCSPCNIFLFSMVQDGPQGPQDVSDPATYGIDWEVADDPTLMCHLLTQNPQDWEEHNPFTPGIADLSDVPCELPNCPFSPEQIVYLDVQLGACVDTTSHSMNVRRLVWKEVFEICNSFYT